MKVGIIGYGNIAKKHQAAIAKLDGCELRAVYDILPVELGADHPLYNNLDVFLQQDLDLITVCSPNGLHAEHSIKALNSGHHVICEKPFALSHTACQEIITAAEANSKKIFCTMQNRYSPVSQWLKKIIDSGALGEINMVNVACYWNRNKNYYRQSDWRGKTAIDGGTLFTQFSHYVDTLYWLLGDMEILGAQLQNFDHGEMIEFEDTGMFYFKFRQGGMGSFCYTTSCFEKNFESTMTLIGSTGTIKVAGQYMDRIEYSNVRDIVPPQLLENDNLANIRAVYENAISNITSDSPIMTTPKDGKAVVALIEEVYKYRTANNS